VKAEGRKVEGESRKLKAFQLGCLLLL